MKREFFVDESFLSQVFQSEEKMTLQVGVDAKVVVPSPSLLFKAEFAREGDDLILQNDDAADIRVVDYFAGSRPPDLVTAQGGQLSGTVAAKLAGSVSPVQYAQAGPITVTNPIGQVETVEGQAVVQRSDGTKEALSVGAKVYQNDVVSTEAGSKLSLTFVDGTMFTLASASRMVLDELVYTPDGDGNSATFSLIEGGFVFVAGQVAKTGEMQVDTPSSTMGIRGTTVLVDIATREGKVTVSVSLTDDFDGGRGEIELKDIDGNLITTILDVDSKWVIPLGDIAYEVERTTDDDASDAETLADAATAFASAYNRVESGQNFVEFSSSSNATSSDGLSGFETGTGDSLGDESDGTGGDSDPGNRQNAPSQGNGSSPNYSDPTELEGNATPGTTDPAVNVDEDGRFTGTLKASDTDGDFVSFSVVTLPRNGTVVLLTTGEFTYTPDKDFNGEDSFGYQVTDGNGGSRNATVTVTVDAVNDAPKARDLDTTSSEDTAVTGTVPTSDVDGDTLTHTIATDPGHGTVKMDEDGSFTYTPDKDFNGEDSFGYQVTDGNGGTRTGTVTVTVDAANDAPKARDLDTETSEDTAVTGTVPTSDVDGDALTHVIATNPGHGTVQMDEDGSFTYTPDKDFNGEDSFGYQVTDDNGSTRTGTVTVTVDAVNDAPVADDVFVKVENGEVIEGTIIATDVDSQTLHFTLGDTTPSKGEVDVSPEGSFAYYPNGSETGFDSFEVEVSDGQETVTVTVTVGIESSGGAAAGTQGLSIELVQDANEDAPAGSATLTRSFVDATPVNIVFALDASGSFANEFGDQIDSVRNAITALRQQFSGSSTQVDIKLVVFNSSATSSATFDLIDDAAAIETELNDIAAAGAGGGTDWAAALNEVKSFFDTENSQTDEVDILYFITDGEPSNTQGQIGEAIANLRNAHEVDILTFGIGGTFNPTQLEQTYSMSGTTHAFDSDGVSQVLDAASDLTEALTATPLFSAQLVSFSLTLVSDGTDHGEIGNQGSDGFTADGLNFLLPFAEIDGIDTKIGDANDFKATAVFDLDGDTGTTSDQVTIVSTERLARPEAGISETGGDLADLLLGGGQADTLRGGDGNDLLLGGGKNDVLRGQAGDDVLVIEGRLDPGAPPAVADGGAGRDVLKIAVAGDLTSDVIPNLKITDIEAIDMTNGKANSLALSLDDLKDLSSEPDSELEDLLGSLPVADSAVIYGDADQTDSLTLSNDEGAIREGATVTDGLGTTLVVYEFLNSSGSVAGVLAVDDDIEVSGVIA